MRYVAGGTGLKQLGRIRYVVARVCLLGGAVPLGAGGVYFLFGSFVAEELMEVSALALVTGLVGAWIALMALQALLAETFRG